jgi:hypothetical protein
MEIDGWGWRSGFGIRDDIVSLLVFSQSVSLSHTTLLAGPYYYILEPHSFHINAKELIILSYLPEERACTPADYLSLVK